MVNTEIRQKGTREAFVTLETNLECTYLLSSQVGDQGQGQGSIIQYKYLYESLTGQTTNDPHSEILEPSKDWKTLSRGDFVNNWT